MAIIKVSRQKTWTVDRWVFDWVLQHVIEKLNKETALYQLLYTRMMTQLGGISYSEVSEQGVRELNVALREVYQDLQIQGLAMFDDESLSDEERRERYETMMDELGNLLKLIET